MADYFPVRLHKSCDLDPKGNYLFGGAPRSMPATLGWRFRIRTDSVEGRIRSDSGGFRAAPRGMLSPRFTPCHIIQVLPCDVTWRA